MYVVCECSSNLPLPLASGMFAVGSIATHIMLHRVMLQKLKPIELAGPLVTRGSWCWACTHKLSSLQRFFHIEILCSVVLCVVFLLSTFSFIPLKVGFYIATPFWLGFFVGELMFSITARVVLRDMMISVQRDSSHTAAELQDALVVARRHLIMAILALSTAG